MLLNRVIRNRNLVVLIGLLAALPMLLMGESVYAKKFEKTTKAEAQKLIDSFLRAQKSSPDALYQAAGKLVSADREPLVKLLSKQMKDEEQRLNAILIGGVLREKALYKSAKKYAKKDETLEHVADEYAFYVNDDKVIEDAFDKWKDSKVDDQYDKFFREVVEDNYVPPTMVKSVRKMMSDDDTDPKRANFCFKFLTKRLQSDAKDQKALLKEFGTLYNTHLHYSQNLKVQGLDLVNQYTWTYTGIVTRAGKNVQLGPRGTMQTFDFPNAAQRANTGSLDFFVYVPKKCESAEFGFKWGDNSSGEVALRVEEDLLTVPTAGGGKASADYSRGKFTWVQFSWQRDNNKNSENRRFVEIKVNSKKINFSDITDDNRVWMTGDFGGFVARGGTGGIVIGGIDLQWK